MLIFKKPSVTFTSNINSETSYGSHSLGTARSVMEILSCQNGIDFYIKWSVFFLNADGTDSMEKESLEEGINFELDAIDPYLILGYDGGVSDIPAEDLQLLKDNGYDVSEIE